jgi:hypothetical protein
MKFQTDIDPGISRNLTNLMEHARAARREYIAGLFVTASNALLRGLRSAALWLIQSQRYAARPLRENRSLK